MRDEPILQEYEMTRHTTNRLMLITLAAAALLAGCGSTPEQQKGTAIGASTGAVTGAVIGAAPGAVVGGAIGAVAGDMWSKRTDEKLQAMERATRGTGIEVSRTPDNELKISVPSEFSFDVGRAAIKPNMRPVLDTFAQNVEPTMRVRVVGHTDATGSDATNDRLSLERAQSVRDYLVGRGVAAARVETTGRGEREPVADNSTATGRAQNRRFEIFLRKPAPKA
jgi:outer membrane protein OmpA-like peptidoglycan-associated protein